MVKFGLGILFLYFPFYVFAQAFTPNADWRFENFNSQNHFVSREIPGLAVDKYGYVWTSTEGLQKFDGYKTMEFNSFNQEPGALRSNSTDIAADNNGRIWINSSGLCYYDDASGKFRYVQSDAKHPITTSQSFCFQKNNLWFICDYGLAKVDLESLKISFTSLTNIDNSLGTYLINDSTLLISSREKVYTYNIKRDTWSANTLTYNHALVKIFTFATNGGTVFLGTDNGLFTFKSLKDISPASNDTKGVSINDLLFLPRDKEKNHLFLATDGGLMLYNINLKRIEFTYVHDDRNPFSLASNIVNRLFADKKGRLWIGTGSGISMFDADNQQWKTRYLSRSSTDDLNISKIARDKYDSTKVWMSSYTRGMILMNWKTKNIERRYTTDPLTQKVVDFVQISKNRLLLATQKKILEWDPQTGVVRQEKLPVPDSLSLVYNIRRIIMTDINTCFITTNKGLFKYNLVTHQISVASQNNKSKKTEVLLKYDLLNGFYDNGILWIASRGGLFSYNVSTQATAIYRGQGGISDYYLFDVSNAPKNRIVCAAGDGLTIFDKQTKSFKIVNSIAGSFKPDCASLLCVNNMVWISAETGILNYDLSTGKSARAELTTTSTLIFPGSPYTIINNDIVVGFRNGYAYFTPEPNNVLAPSAPVIEGLYVNNRAVLQQHPNQITSQKLVFNHSQNSINIAFTAFLYTDPSHINFRYRLKGADADWQYTGDQRNANYAQLQPGDYTFYVQSGNKNGNWNNQTASVIFVIRPPYWETWWFRGLVILTIAFGLYNLYRYRIKNILAIERLREKIASDFHDDIGSALSSISIFSEVADKQLRQEAPSEQTREIIGHISFHSRAMLDAMDDIVWAVNPQNDHFNDLAVRMREFAIPLLEARNIQFEITIQEDILKTRLKMDVRKNIFLIFKECINNVLKHSACSAMKVSVSKLNNQLQMIISDDGKGYDINAKNTRNGLKNMQKRAIEINGTLQVTTGLNKGTETKLLVNII
ncbi:MAG: triple tyrosine motif-containing protein [Sphingobacteriales bacterium]